MKLIYLFLAILISCSCEEPLVLNKNKEEKYYVTSTYNYVYINLKTFSSSDTIYLKIECDNGDIQQSIYYGYADSTSSESTTSSASPYSTVTTTVNSDETKTYYYSLSYNSYNYIVVQFTKSYWSNFNMKLEASDSNPISGLVTIILAIVFSIIGFVIIIVVIVIICICRRRRTVGMVGGPAYIAPMAPQTPLVNSNMAYPQTAPMY